MIIDSAAVREYGFRKIFEQFDVQQVDELILYHNANGGLSRFHKIRYFYNEILHKKIENGQVELYAQRFSEIMRMELVNKKYLVMDSLEFIQRNFMNYNFHIVSGSEEKELSFLCEALGIRRYFHSIHGSPTPKIELVRNLLIQRNYLTMQTILIGDSINDYDASKANNIAFYGYNNEKLREVGSGYIECFHKDLFS